MGDFFSKFKKSLDKGVNTVSIKSNTMVEINKVKSNTTTLKNTIQAKKMEIANNFYDMYLEDAIEIEKCISICEEIKNLEAEIKVKEAEIEGIKAKEEILLAEANKPEEAKEKIVITPNVVEVAAEVEDVSEVGVILETERASEVEVVSETERASEVEVISEAGSISETEVLEEVEAVKEEAAFVQEVETKTCECGAILQEGMKFCVQCGTKVEW